MKNCEPELLHDVAGAQQHITVIMFLSVAYTPGTHSMSAQKCEAQGQSCCSCHMYPDWACADLHRICSCYKLQWSSLFTIFTLSRRQEAEGLKKCVS